jgi:rod shape-determining protein MreB
MTDEEVREALSDSVSTIINAVRVALERTPPELSADIVERGIVLTGGGALLKNLDKRLMIETGLPVVLADDPLSSVVLGTGKMLSDFELLKRVKWDNSLMTGNWLVASPMYKVQSRRMISDFGLWTSDLGL